ncbi:MAG TPA: hypothetical protein PKH65_06570 [Bacteroidia bacterium]|nr:hypothetical protein [Bacteroidia bacterium]HNT80331.1 hypothetical protein [Bacteroidia bacterium]
MALMICPFDCISQTMFIIKDNSNTLYNSNTYQLSSDSIILRCVSDYGRSRFTYLEKALTEEQKLHFAKSVNEILKLEFDSVYFTPFHSPDAYIDESSGPRVFDFSIQEDGHIKMHTSINNSYLLKYKKVVDFVNHFLSDEIKIKYTESEFTK